MTLAEDLRQAALDYTRAGWPVFPIRADGKRPVPIHGFKNATTAEERVLTWWDGRAMYNIAVATGYPGPDVLDVDVREGNGWAAYWRLANHGLLTGAHRIVCTPSGGGHFYYAGTTQRCGAIKGAFLDMKRQGGYILLPPSVINGVPYQIMADRPQTGAVIDWDACKRLLEGPKRVWVGTPSPRLVASLPARVLEQGCGNRNS